MVDLINIVHLLEKFSHQYFQFADMLFGEYVFPSLFVVSLAHRAIPPAIIYTCSSLRCSHTISSSYKLATTVL